MKLRVAYGLLALSVVPILGGVARLANIGNADGAPMDARFAENPWPVIAHVLAALDDGSMGFQLARRRVPDSADTHRAGAIPSSSCAAPRRFVAAHWTSPRRGPKVPACRCASGLRKHTMNHIRTVLHPAAFVPLPSAAGDAAANPPGFDRVAYLPQLENQVAAFFAEQWP